MNSIRVYLYDSSKEENGYRGTDYSANVLQGGEETEDITQELDTAEITLIGLPFYKEFTPETKFIVDIVSEQNGIEEIRTLHLCVSRDTVIQPILSDENYYDHHISFIEPSVVAQKRLVDNISATYKLKDVTLEEKPGFPEVTVGVEQDTSISYPKYSFGVGLASFTTSTDWLGRTVITEKLAYCGGEYFSFEGALEIKNKAGETSGLQYNDIANFGTAKEGGTLVTEGKATFIIPKLKIHRGGRDGHHSTYIVLGYASIDVTINEYDLTDPNTITGTWTETFISNSDLGATNIIEDHYTNVLDGEWLLEQIDIVTATGAGWSSPKYYYKKYTDKNAADATYEIEIPIKVDKKYTVSISLHQFNDTIQNNGGLINSSYPSLGVWYNVYTGEQPSFWEYAIRTRQYYSTSPDNYISNVMTEAKKESMTSSNTTGTGSFIFYNADTKTVVYSSSTPYSALALLQKAILNASTYEKIDGVYIADVNKSKLPFYIDTQFQDELASTQIIENFYNQKNLWEICLEVGHYIHAIPRIEFGADDRFLITFDELGRTDKKTDTESTKVSIYNSRSVESYISATSSYVTNMVQLGGTISEWVTPKTTDEQLLVYNDTAEIIVSKPIIELLNVTVRCNVSKYEGINEGEEADLTPYIYEENVYKLLGIDYKTIPNRGIAMYYSLGDNVIKGGQYQLPQEKNNIYTDYSFKKILYSAYNGYPVIDLPPLVTETDQYWSHYIIRDFSFHITYRTKDSVRQNHIRPDLRKYLLNSKYDKYPEHNQFNNQTDIVVDSVSFGNNIYGTLIKTGNSTYETVEWHNDYTAVKHKGELYEIRGDLYYVAKVTHYVYSSHILSKVTFSKDYNELSMVVGIPSEPRFYEISEQSAISREKSIDEILLLTDNLDDLSYGTNYVFNNFHLAQLMLGTGTDFAKYALTVFKGDKDTSLYDQTVGQANLYKEILSPINAYSSENTLTYEWDMADNYSAGDKVIITTKDAYNSLWAVPYTDIYGKAALFDFYILGDVITLTANEIKALPESPIATKADTGDGRTFVGNCDILATNVTQYDTNFNGRGIGLLKDCREQISINYNLQLATSSDTFVVSPFVFLPNKDSVSIVLLSQEVNKISNGYIPISAIIQPLNDNGEALDKYMSFAKTHNNVQNGWGKTVTANFGINLADILAGVSSKHFEANNENYARVKSIAVVCNVDLNSVSVPGVEANLYKAQFIIARNIPDDWNKEKAVSPIYFGAPLKEKVFANKQ